MARQRVTFEVENTKYLLTQFGASEGKTWLLRLTKVFGQAVGAAAPVGAQLSLKSLLDFDFGKGVQRLTESIREDELDALCKAFAANCAYVEGDREPELGRGTNFDEHFAGRYDAWAKWLYHCLRVNFGSFLNGYTALAAMVPTGQAAKTEGNPSPTS